MSWPIVLLLIIGPLLFLMGTGMPVALGFMIVNLMGIWLVMGEAGLSQLSSSMLSSLATFTLLPVPMFILMGELLFRARLAEDVLDAVDAWFGNLPGRLSLLVAAVGALFGTFSGSSTATTAMLGSSLAPQMKQRGYSDSMTLGPILGSGGLAIMIPPSGLAVILGAIGQISVGGILLAIIVPGVLLAVLYGIYIVVAARLRPDLAPPYDAHRVPLAERVGKTIKYILPLGFLLFLVVGLILLGVATPEESAAAGVIGAVAMIFAYGRASAKVFIDAVRATVMLTGMILILIAGATSFSQLLSFTGATMGLADFVVSLPAPPVMLIGVMMLTVLFLGCFMGPVPIMLITLPPFLPAVATLGFDEIWFAVLFLLAIEMSFSTPPYGVNLFVLKGTVPGTSFKSVALAAIPYLIIDAVLMVIIMAWPDLALWLPSLVG